MKLFGHPDSGHAFKVRFFLTAHDIEHDYELVDIYSERTHRQPEFVRWARYGEVPLLLRGDRALTQSNAILLYLAQQFSLGIGNSAAANQECTEWLMWEANKIGMCLPQLRSFQREGMNKTQQEARPWLQMRYEHDIGVIEKVLSDGRPWIIRGEQPTIADFSLSAYLFYADEADVTVPEHTRAWLQRLTQLAGYKHPYELMAM